MDDQGRSPRASHETFANFTPGKFVCPHDATFDQDGSIFVAEWVAWLNERPPVTEAHAAKIGALFESLFVGDSNAEITHKLAMRVAALSAIDAWPQGGPAEIFAFVKRSTRIAPQWCTARATRKRSE